MNHTMEKEKTGQTRTFWDLKSFIILKSYFYLHLYTNRFKYHRIRTLISVGTCVGNSVENFSLHKVVLLQL